ncbi:hypothetical protein PT974_07317 [Cladobotryum mycophilum]|uniref:Uncharacterized protein n=1 Tax=Cladobotryum mycophilum TaxID=491253 RepID=A0ABR0SNZ8_9HYPO
MAVSILTEDNLGRLRKYLSLPPPSLTRNTEEGEELAKLRECGMELEDKMNSRLRAEEPCELSELRSQSIAQPSSQWLASAPPSQCSIGAGSMPLTEENLRQLIPSPSPPPPISQETLVKIMKGEVYTVLKGLARFKRVKGPDFMNTFDVFINEEEEVQYRGNEIPDSDDLVFWQRKYDTLESILGDMKSIHHGFHRKPAVLPGVIGSDPEEVEELMRLEEYNLQLKEKFTAWLNGGDAVPEPLPGSFTTETFDCDATISQSSSQSSLHIESQSPITTSDSEDGTNISWSNQGLRKMGRRRSFAWGSDIATKLGRIAEFSPVHLTAFQAMAQSKNKNGEGPLAPLQSITNKKRKRGEVEGEAADAAAAKRVKEENQPTRRSLRQKLQPVPMKLTPAVCKIKSLNKGCEFFGRGSPRRSPHGKSNLRPDNEKKAAASPCRVQKQDPQGRQQVTPAQGYFHHPRSTRAANSGGTLSKVGIKSAEAQPSIRRSRRLAKQQPELTALPR